MIGALDPEPGVRYVFVSRGVDTNSAAELMLEGPCIRVMSGDRSAEIHLVKAAEHAFQVELRAAGAKDPEAAASRAIAQFASAHPSQQQTDVFGRYLWARVQPTFLRSPERPTREIVSLLTAHAAPRGVRIEIVAGLDAVAQGLGADLEFVRTVASGYVALLLDPAASDQRVSLVEVSLYFLLLPGDQPRFPAGKVFPDPAERARLRKALEPFSSDRAKKLASWLAG